MGLASFNAARRRSNSNSGPLDEQPPAQQDEQLDEQPPAQQDEPARSTRKRGAQQQTGSAEPQQEV